MPVVRFVKQDQTVEMRPVVPDRTTGTETVIRSGVQPGETVVVDGHLRLVPGAKVVAEQRILRQESPTLNLYVRSKVRRPARTLTTLP